MMAGWHSVVQQTYRVPEQSATYFIFLATHIQRNRQTKEKRPSFSCGVCPSFLPKYHYQQEKYAK
jgi:hypothetical protein